MQTIKLILTEKGIFEGGEYCLTKDNNKYIVWNDNLLDGKYNLIINDSNKSDLKEKKNYKLTHMNLELTYGLKRSISKLVDEKLSLDEISKKLNTEHKEIYKIVSSLPRIKSKYISYHGPNEFVKVEENVSYKKKETKKTKNNIDTNNHKEVLKNLITGFNPITGEELSNEHIINNPIIRKTFMDIYETLNSLESQNKDNKIEEIELSDKENELYNVLREWRRKLSIEISKPLYIISSNNALKYISKLKPRTKDEFISIKGISEKFFDLYSDDVIKILDNFLD